MKVLGICTGNGMAIHAMKPYVIGSIEPRACFHTKGEKQWNANFKGKFFERHLVDGISPDVIITNPDCGHSSIFRLSRAKKNIDSSTNDSLWLSISGILAYKPKFFLLENLPGFLKTFKKSRFKKLFKKDYRLLFHEGPVSDFGNSQIHRKRIIIIGIRRDAPLRVKKIMQKIYPVREIKFTGRLLKGLKKRDWDLGHVWEAANEPLTIYGGKKITLEDARKFWRNNPTAKRWPVYDRKYTTAPGVYRNLADEYPATARKQNRQFNPRGLQMSPRELARIQGVPDNFKIYMEPEQAQYWINKGRVTIAKSAPYEIAEWFYLQLLKVNKKWPTYLSIEANN